MRWVFGAMTPALRESVIAFWLKEGALHSVDEAWRRSWEVACLLETGDGDIAGACTVAARLDENNKSCGFVRIFVRTDNRLLAFPARMISRMVLGFRELMYEPGAPRRLIATIENRKLERPAAQRTLARLGFVPAGTVANGEILMQCVLEPSSSS